MPFLQNAGNSGDLIEPRAVRPPVADFLHEDPKSSIDPAVACAEAGPMNRPAFPLKGRSSLRKGRSSEIGRIYLVTFCTMQRRPVFSEWPAARAFSRSLYSRALLRQSRLLSWVLMPDHWHGLVELGPSDTLSTLVGRIKGATANAVNSERGSRGGLWAVGFHGHALRREEDLRSVARYVVLNPVRAGLAEKAGHYPFWDAIWLDEEHRG
jgi:putative transposase